MDSDEKLSRAVALIDKQIASALRSTRKFREIWGNGKLEYRKRIGGFATIIQPSQDEVEYDFFKSSIEFSVRNNMVNPILDALFDLYDIDAGWPEGSIIAWSNNGRHEIANPIEFAITANGETVGYRYTIPESLTAMDIIDILESWRIDRIVVIDWSGVEADELKQQSTELCIGGSDYVSQITAGDFFNGFFPEGLYDELLSRVRAAVDKAEDIIGFQAISKLSMPRLAPFRASVIDEIHHVIDDLSDSLNVTGSDGTIYRLTSDDRNILNRAFFDDGLGRCLSGTKGFARCFTTSEYLRKSFSQGGEFDYTSVVCGYLKAIEQLADELMRATLGTQGSENLYIATFKRRGCQFKRPFDWSEETPHVQFIYRNRKRFSTTLPPLANLLHDNETSWRISDEGRHFVLLKLRAFADKDRNGYFHKDNFTDLSEVNKIRKDAIALLYFLVGGYIIPGSKDRMLEVLGMKYVPYSDMYMKLSEIPVRDFVLEFEGQDTVKAIRLFEQPVVEYDEYGLVSSKLYFIRVDDHRGSHEWESIETVNKNDVIEVSRDNMPTKLFYVRRDGEQVQFW